MHTHLFYIDNFSGVKYCMYMLACKHIFTMCSPLDCCVQTFGEGPYPFYNLATELQGIKIKHAYFIRLLY